MKQIEFERWAPDAENPRKLTYAGQRTAEEVFQDLTAQLDSVGYLPDEYFLMDMHWKNGREIPKDADFFCKTDSAEAKESIWTSIWNGRRATSPKRSASSPAKRWAKAARIWTECSLSLLRSRKRSAGTTASTRGTWWSERSQNRRKQCSCI